MKTTVFSRLNLCRREEGGDLELASRELLTAMEIMIHGEKEKTGS